MKSGEAAVIEALLHEHEAIRAYIISAAALVADPTTRKLSCTDRSEKFAELMRSQMNLGERLRYFEEGLKQHHRCEEKTIPEFIGGLLMEPILIEHRAMIKELNDINYLLSDVNPEGLIIDKKYIKIIIDSFVSWVIDHCTREDKLLKILVQECSWADSYFSNAPS